MVEKYIYFDINSSINNLTKHNEEARRDYFLTTQPDRTENEKIRNKEEKEKDNDEAFKHVNLGAIPNENNDNIENEEYKNNENNKNQIDIENNENEIIESAQDDEKNDENQEIIDPKYKEKIINNLLPYIIVSFSEKQELDKIKLNIRFKNCKKITNEIVQKSINHYKKRKLFNNDFEFDICSLKKVKK